MRSRCVALLLTVLALRAAAAQDNACPAPIQPGLRELIANQLEPSYITLGGPPANIGQLGNLRPFLLFEGNLAQHLSLAVSDAKNLAFVFTPKITIRALNIPDHPVRTPSYMPHLTVYFAPRLLRFTRPDTVSADCTQELDVRHIMFWLRLAHYSNGQEDPADNPDGSLNVKSGGFNANYAELGLTTLQTHDVVRGDVQLSSHTSASIRWYARDTTLFDPGLTHGYGARRLRASGSAVLSWGSKTKSPRLRLMYEGELWTNKRDGNTLSIALAYRPRYLDDFWFFARWYDGQDYYNIHWRDPRLHTLQMGVMAIANRPL